MSGTVGRPSIPQGRPPRSNDGSYSEPESGTRTAGPWSSGLGLSVLKRNHSTRQRVASLFKKPAQDHPTWERSQPPPAQDVTQLLSFDAHRPFAISPSCDLYKARYRTAVAVVRRIRFQDDEDTWESKLRTAAARLVLARNDHVLPYIGICNHEGSLCLVSPFASGGDLKTHLQTNPGCDRLSLLRQVIDGLTYLHNTGLVHGSIHTRNILLDGETVKLSDFGLKELIPGDGTTSMRPKFVREKAVYCAPEMHGGAAPSMSCDVYSFGMLVFHVYCGREPMIDGYPQALQVVAALLQGRRPERQEVTRPDFTEHLWSLCQRCWAREAKARPSAAGVQEALRLGPTAPKSPRRSWTPLRRK